MLTEGSSMAAYQQIVQMTELAGRVAPLEGTKMVNEIERRFIKVRVADTRCPDEIRAKGISDDVVYLLRERIECAHWRHVKDYFVGINGRHIVSQPVAARRYLTIHPERVVAAMKQQGIW
ncbi:MAG: hypothetical protein ACYS8X_05425 [Planctomycetota bacterium]|jgi:hypothetical protein